MPDSDLLGRLRSIIRAVETRSADPDGKSTVMSLSADWLSPMVERLGLEEQTLDGKPYYVSERVFGMDDRFGRVALKNAIASPKAYVLLGLDEELAGFSLQKTLFVDLETTGLGHGTGNHAFLVGTAELAGGSLVVRQFFMPDPSYEETMLQAVAWLARTKDWLVTFNGKSFDIPLLETRLTLNRVRSAFCSLYNFDLLHAARRLWRNVHACSLTELERSVMGFERDGDLPGALIPSVYFEFLKDKNPAPLSAVFVHNCWDVVSMVALLAKMCECVCKPDPDALCSTQAYNLGRLFERAGMTGMSADFYGLASSIGRSSGENTRALLSLARMKKRQSELDDAAKLWERALMLDKGCIEAYTELAKYLEHTKKDLAGAQAVCREALIAANLWSSEKVSRHTIDSLKRRQARLTDKARRRCEH